MEDETDKTTAATAMKDGAHEGRGMSGNEARVFRLSIDVRSFKAGRRLPMKAANVFVRVSLPQEIIKLAMAAPCHGNAAKLTAPMRTHPPVNVERGAEMCIPNGYVALELPASVNGLAATLAQDPQLIAQIFHRDRYAADTMIGSASISMEPLMTEPWVDGYALVYSSSIKDSDERVNLGSLRVVLSAEELGPVTDLHKHGLKKNKDNSSGIDAADHHPSLEEPFIMLKKNMIETIGSKAIAMQKEQGNIIEEGAELKTKPSKAAENDVKLYGNLCKRKTSGKKQVKSFEGSDSDYSSNGQSSTPNQDAVIRKQPEYELAWEFEMWRRSEEAKWQSELKDKELKVIAALEEQWRKRDTDRMHEVDNTRMELAALESKLRAKLFALEKRERELVLAEETASMGREALNRDYAQRASVAEVAVKRLQSECEHRVELERAKYEALKEQYEALERRLLHANSALADVEKQFTVYKAKHRNTSEAELSAQLMLVKQQCSDLQRKVESALRSRNEYKAQVLRMAKEIACLHHQNVQGNSKRHSEDAGQAALASLVETHARRSRQEKQELQQLKEQLERLQKNEQSTMVAANTSAVANSVVTRQIIPEELKDRNVEEIHLTSGSSKSNENNIGIDERAVNGMGLKPNIPNLPALKSFPKSRQSGDHLEQWLEDSIKNNNKATGEVEVPWICSAQVQMMGQKEVEIGEVRSEEDCNVVVENDLSAFQKSEIERLSKQKADLLRSGVYGVQDRIILGLDQEIQRLQSVDMSRFNHLLIYE